MVEKKNVQKSRDAGISEEEEKGKERTLCSDVQKKKRSSCR